METIAFQDSPDVPGSTIMKTIVFITLFKFPNCLLQKLLFLPGVPGFLYVLLQKSLFLHGFSRVVLQWARLAHGYLNALKSLGNL